MQLDVSLGATAARKSVLETDSKKTWIATETDAYTCQTARVHMVQVTKDDRGATVILRVVPVLMSDQRRQDMDVSVSLISDDHEVRKPVIFEGLTVGDDNSTPNKMQGTIVGFFGSHTKAPEANFVLSEKEFAALWGPEGRAPSVRIVVKIADD